MPVTYKPYDLKSKFLSLASILSLLLFGLTCNKSGTIGRGTQFVNLSITGRVLDQNKIPLSNVLVETGEQNVMTDINGNFTLNNVSANKDDAVVKLSRDEYFTSYRTFTPTANTINYIEVTLITRNSSGIFSAATGGVVSVLNGGSINFPAYGMINAANNVAYIGPVRVFSFFINPTTSDFRSTLPGDLRGINIGGQQVGLQSFGMIVVELKGSGGEELQLASGRQATITFPIPSSIINQAPAAIPLWYFDETTGQWKEEGTAQKQGSNYVGTVSHFSFWNCDAPYPIVNFTATIQDQQNRPVAAADVEIKRTNGSPGYGKTDANGKVSGLIPANEALKIIVRTRCSSDSMNIGPFSADQDLGVLHVNTNNPHVQAIIKGTVVKCSGGVVTNGYVNISAEGENHRATINNGSFTYTLYKCNGNPSTAQLVATDMSTNAQNSPVTISIASGNVNAGQLSTCVTLTQFINFTLNSTAYSMTMPADSIRATVDQIIQTEIWGVNLGGSTNREFILGFLANTPITTAIDFLEIEIGTTKYYKPNSTNLNVSITEFGPAGQFIAGNFSGNIRDSTYHTTVPVNCNFRVRRFN